MAAKKTGRTESLEEFAVIVRDLRTSAGLSQADLAVKIRVSPGYIGLIETGSRGTRPSLRLVKALIEATRAPII